MDEHIMDHSDSDSGESWTILENSSQFPDDVPDFPKDPTESLICDVKDEDTDGISIISDSDHESTVLIKDIEGTSINEEEISAENHFPSHASTSPQHSNLDDNLNFDGSFRNNDNFFMESNEKLKTYVHRRNKKLSTTLNIIMLGSVITAAGVAIGHMWGAKNDCAVHSIPSVNKILSNLYKLQEENAFLRNKLKELTLLSNSQKQQQNMPLKQKRCKKVFEEPLNSETVRKVTKCLDDRNIKDERIKHQRCKKVFEEPLNSETVSKVTKCLDDGRNTEDERILESPLTEPPFEKEFLNDVEKMKNVYGQNKHWLDNEISKRIQYEDQQLRFIQKKQKPIKQKPPFEENKTFLDENTKYTEENLISPSKAATMLNDFHDSKQEETQTIKKISYADSVKSEHKNVQKSEANSKLGNENNENVNERKLKRMLLSLENVEGEEEIKKDDRYNCHKCKYYKKKSDKWSKKQTKKKRYDQLDFNKKAKDDIHKKQQENDNEWNTAYQTSNIIEHPKSEVRENLEEYRNSEKSTTKLKMNENDFNNENKSTWYEKRASFRKQSRKQLELELFGEKSFNDSGWYFRRMKRREQCRAKSNNSTHKKVSKLNMNFKMKY